MRRRLCERLTQLGSTQAEVLATWVRVVLVLRTVHHTRRLTLIHGRLPYHGRPGTTTASAADGNAAAGASGTDTAGVGVVTTRLIDDGAVYEAHKIAAALYVMSSIRILRQALCLRSAVETAVLGASPLSMERHSHAREADLRASYPHLHRICTGAAPMHICPRSDATGAETSASAPRNTGNFVEALCGLTHT